MIKLTEKIGYGFGDMASSMFWKLFGAYLMIFYISGYSYMGFRVRSDCRCNCRPDFQSVG